MKNCEDFGKTKNEDSRGLIYSGRNSILKLQGKLFEDEDLKATKIGETRPGNAIPYALGTCHAPWAWL